MGSLRYLYLTLFRASRIRNLSTRFFMHLITCLRTRLCTFHFVHLKQSFLHACTLMSTSPCIYYKDRNILKQKLNLVLFHSPSTQNLVWVSRLFFYRRRNNRRVCCLPRTKQPDNVLSNVFESSEHGSSFPVAVRLLASISGDQDYVGMEVLHRLPRRFHIMVAIFIVVVH